MIHTEKQRHSDKRTTSKGKRQQKKTEKTKEHGQAEKIRNTGYRVAGRQV